MKNNRLLKLLCRFLKERGMYTEFYKVLSQVPYSIFNKSLVLYWTHHQDFLYYLGSKYNKTSRKFKSFTISPNNNQTFNKIVFIDCKLQILKFIDENNLRIKINENLKLINCLISDKCVDFNDYMNAAIEKGNSPLSLILDIFHWSRSIEGYDYWSDINFKFKNYLMDYLVNDYMIYEK